MKEYIKVTKALADETRVRIVMALADGELCVCSITEMLGLAASTVSKHLSILRNAGLVDSRKEGRWIHYRLSQKPGKAAAEAIAMTLSLLQGNEKTLRDKEKLNNIPEISSICKK